MRASAPWGLLLGSQSTCLEKAQTLARGWMSESEQRRLAVQQTVTRQSSFVACRYALRLLLAEEEQLVTEWRLGSVAEHKPWVEASVQSKRRGEHSLPQLSLSHSGAWLACAKAPIPVGVDLEVHGHGRLRNVQALAELVCTKSELVQLQQLSSDMQQLYFFQLWCLKEAYFKCLGTGLDLASIKKKIWHRSSDLRGMHAESLVEQPAVAYGKLWQTCLKDGGSLYLALCALQPLPAITPWQVSGASITWGSLTEWCLHEEALIST
jgi:4'-phosphopantetheinyl transferase